jgi:hypothetical protein
MFINSFSFDNIIKVFFKNGLSFVDVETGLYDYELKLLYQTTVKSTSTALIGMIPAGLYLLTSIALAVGVIKLAKDKTLITSEMYADAQACVDLLKTSDATKWYFQEDNPFEEDVERLYQLKFKGEYEGIPLRIMADNIIVDHKNKIIYPTDLKTSYKAEWNFYKSFIEWGYYHQANLYAEIIRQNIEKDEYFKDFKIADYRFIVVCNRTRVPLVWEWSYTKTTVDFKIGDVEFPNWRGIVKQLDYYLREEPPVPEGIVVEDTNNIAKFIEKYGR